MVKLSRQLHGLSRSEWPRSDVQVLVKMHRKRRLPTHAGLSDGPTEAKQKCVRTKPETVSKMSLRVPIRDVLASLHELRLKNKLCDWIIKTNDNKEMPAHGPVLSIASPYFRKLLTDTWKKGLRNHVISIDIPSSIMHDILDYTYTGKVALFQENVENILMAASKFLFHDVVRECYKFIKKELLPENCLYLYKINKAYLPEDLSENLLQYICHHFREVLLRSGQTVDLSADELQLILSRDDLNIAEEAELFDLVVKWVLHDLIDREQHLLQLVKCLRLGRLDPGVFARKVKRTALVQGDPLVQRYLSEVEKLFSHPQQLSLDPRARQRFPNDVVLVFGGWTGNFQQSYSFVEVFDKCAAQWFPLKCAGSPTNKEFYYHGLCVLDSKVYILGGCCDSLTWSTTSRVLCFDPLAMTWEEKACMYEARSNACVVAFNECIYAIGGFDRFFNLDSVERYDPLTNQWSKVASMNDARSEASAATLDGRIYVAGGFASDDVLQSVEIYNPCVDQWTLLSPMTSPRYGLCLVAYHGALYAIGGNDGLNQTENVEKLEPTRTPYWLSAPEMSTSRKDFAAVVLDDELFVMGGADDWSSIASTEVFNWKDGEWRVGPQLYQKRCGLAACVLSGLQNAREYSYLAFREGLSSDQT